MHQCTGHKWQKNIFHLYFLIYVLLLLCMPFIKNRGLFFLYLFIFYVNIMIFINYFPSYFLFSSCHMSCIQIWFNVILTTALKNFLARTYVEIIDIINFATLKFVCYPFFFFFPFFNPVILNSTALVTYCGKLNESYEKLTEPHIAGLT